MFDDFSEFCSTTFGTLHFEKSSNTTKILVKMKKNGYFWNQKCSQCHDVLLYCTDEHCSYEKNNNNNIKIPSKK